MYSFIYSKSALLFYLFVLLTEFATKRGLKQIEETGKTSMLPLADLCGFCSFIYIILFSIYTVWWASILLVVCYLLIFQLFRLVISLSFINKKYIYLISNGSKFFLIPVSILMFVLINK